MKAGTQRVISNVDAMRRAVEVLTRVDVLVGVPATNGPRTTTGRINNAALLYIHDHGAPEVGIPARPTMPPGIRDAQAATIARFREAGKAAIQGRGNAVMAQLHAVGLENAAAIKKRIDSNTAPPLSPRTVAQRYRQRSTATRRSSEDRYLDMVRNGVSPGDAQRAAGIVSLVNTGQMRNSVTHVLRPKGK